MTLLCVLSGLLPLYDDMLSALCPVPDIFCLFAQPDSEGPTAAHLGREVAVRCADYGAWSDVNESDHKPVYRYGVGLEEGYSWC